MTRADDGRIVLRQRRDVFLSEPVAVALDASAKTRGCTRIELLTRIIEKVFEDDLVDAVLDDAN